MTLQYKRIGKPTGLIAEDAVDSYTDATGGTALRYDPTAGQLVYNWQTPRTKGFDMLTLTGQDGTALKAKFSLK